jgi:hypothetical protein
MELLPVLVQALQPLQPPGLLQEPQGREPPVQGPLPVQILWMRLLLQLLLHKQSR